LNNLLQLKGQFEQASSKSRPGPPKLPTGKSVKVTQLEFLLSNLIELKGYWEKQRLLPGVLISVCYNKVAAKSNRVQGLLGKGSIKPSESIVGARFSLDGSPKHIITHYISRNILDESILRLKACISILKKDFNNEITEQIISQINKKEILFSSKLIAKVNFLKVVIDAYYVEKFDILIDDVQLKSDSIAPQRIFGWFYTASLDSVKRVSVDSISLVRFYNKQTHPLDSSVIDRLNTLRKAYGRPSLSSQQNDINKESTNTRPINKAAFVKRSHDIDVRLTKSKTN
jgi:hypothetical protein